MCRKVELSQNCPIQEFSSGPNLAQQVYTVKPHHTDTHTVNKEDKTITVLQEHLLNY